MRDAYSKHLGHKCGIERWLVVGEGGLAGTFKRIPHIVSMFQANGTACCKATQPASFAKEQLIEADQAFRRELQKKNMAAKAKAAAAPGGAPAGGAKAAAVPGGPPAAAAKAPSAASKAPPPAVPAPTPKASSDNGPTEVPKKAAGPTRPPATIEDFLWNLHSVLESYDGPLPIDQLKEVYSKQLGHKCAIERFLVVGDVGLAGTLKRIPHVVTVSVNNGQASLTPTLARGSKREDLVQADQNYRKNLQQKNLAAKAAGAAKPAAQPPAASAKPAPAAPAPAAQTRPSEGGGEPDAKRQKSAGDAETLSRMLVQGVVRVLQARAKEGKGPLLVSNLAEEFKTLWKVPFNLASAGYTDVNTFLKAWPNKVELTSDASGDVVTLAKKGDKSEAKAPPAAPVAPATKAAPADVPPVAKKAPPPAAPQPKAEAPAAVAAAPAAAPAAAESADGEPDAKKAKTTDQDTLSRMLVQGVVRVLQSRSKEGKGELLVSNLAEEFKALWKVPFNLQSAGYTDVNTFLKAWPNKVELTSHAHGDVVSLAKKGGEKAAVAKANDVPAGAKSAAPAAAKSAPTAPAKAAAPVAEHAAQATCTSSASATKPSAADGSDLDAPIPTTAIALRAELAKNVRELEDVTKLQHALAERQKELIEALSRIS